MIFGGILAGGTGSRMNISDMPKQFLNLGDNILYSFQRFYKTSVLFLFKALQVSFYLGSKSLGLVSRTWLVLTALRHLYSHG